MNVIVLCIPEFELIIPVEPAPKRRYIVKINSKAILFDIGLFHLSFFHDSLLIISTKTKIVIETNMLAKVANTSMLDSVEAISDMFVL